MDKSIERIEREIGTVDWTQKLLSDSKERLVISGIGSERVCMEFGDTRLQGAM